jgi:hypothetical protein
MTERQTPYPSEERHAAAPPLPATTGMTGTTGTTGTTVEPTSGKARHWLAGAMLVTVGLVAGSGATYAFTSTPTSNVPGTTSGYGRGGFGGGPAGDPLPGGLGQSNGTLLDQGQADGGSTAPSTDTSTSTDSQPA